MDQPVEAEPSTIPTEEPTSKAQREPTGPNPDKSVVVPEYVSLANSKDVQ